MANTQLTQYQQYIFGELKAEDVKTIQETIAKDCNESQFRLFMAVAKAADANPLLGEIHPSVFSGKLTWQFGIEFYVRKAKETDGFRGHDVQLVHENHVFKRYRKRGEDGRYYDDFIHEAEEKEDGSVISGYAIAYKEGMPPFFVYMTVAEVEHYKRSSIGMQKTMWTNNFNDMFKKHMLKRALKGAFGIKFEDASADNAPDSYEPTHRRDVTEEVNAASQSANNQQQPDRPKEQSQEQHKKPEDTKPLIEEVGKKLLELGIIEKPAKTAYFEENGIKFKDPKNPTVAEIKGLIKLLDLHIAEKQQVEQDELPV